MGNRGFFLAVGKSKRQPVSKPEWPPLCSRKRALLFHHLKKREREREADPALLTYEVVPLSLQLPLVGQASAHDVETVVVTGLDGHEATAEWAVHHLGQGANPLGRGVDL